MRYLTFLLPLMLIVTACGGGSSDQQQEANDADTESTTTESAEVRTIDIIGIDQMKYVVDDEDQEGVTTGEAVGSDNLVLLEAISAEPGEEIRIRLTTQSELPATAMSHNFILIAQTADAAAFNKAAMTARDNDYIPADMSDQIIAHTGLAGGGETVEVTFTVPEEAGEYEFVCSFPGHYVAGMRGTLNVE